MGESLTGRLRSDAEGALPPSAALGLVRIGLGFRPGFDAGIGHLDRLSFGLGDRGLACRRAGLRRSSLAGAGALGLRCRLGLGVRFGSSSLDRSFDDCLGLLDRVGLATARALGLGQCFVFGDRRGRFDQRLGFGLDGDFGLGLAPAARLLRRCFLRFGYRFACRSCFGFGCVVGCLTVFAVTCFVNLAGSSVLTRTAAPPSWSQAASR